MNNNEPQVIDEMAQFPLAEPEQPKPSHHTIHQLRKAGRRLKRIVGHANRILAKGKHGGKDLTQDGVRFFMGRLVRAQNGQRLLAVELETRRVTQPAVRLAMPLKMQRSLGLLPAV